MKRVAVFLTVTIALVAAPPVEAVDFPNLGIFRKKTPKPEPSGKTKQLVATLQSDPDEKKRVQAAEELRTVDPRSNPDIVPTLIGALQKDPSTAVRKEAVDSIGKLKPVSPTAAVAMEMALQSDPDSHVRDAIKAALWQYHLNGYRPPPASSALTKQTAEPPITTGRPSFSSMPKTGADIGFKPITNTVGKGVPHQSTAEPPLAKPKSATQPTVNPPSPTILPPPMPAGSVPEPTAKPATGTPAPLPSIPLPTTPNAAPPAGGALPTIPVPPPTSKPSF